MRALTAADGILGRAARHHLGSRGKRLRARLAWASTQALGLSDLAGVSLAASVELLHEASLVHDDLQDADIERRGHPTVWAAYGRDVALLLGDHLIAQSFAALAQIDGSATAALIGHHSRAVRALAEGQMSDVVGWSDACATRDQYNHLARQKTGTLLALPIVAAGELAGLERTQLARAGTSQSWLGVAFQVLNDLADILGTDRPQPGTDERMGRPNAVLLESADSAPAEVRIAAQLQHALDRARHARRGLPDNLVAVLEAFACEIEVQADRLRSAAGRSL